MGTRVKDGVPNAPLREALLRRRVPVAQIAEELGLDAEGMRRSLGMKPVSQRLASRGVRYEPKPPRSQELINYDRAVAIVRTNAASAAGIDPVDVGL